MRTTININNNLMKRVKLMAAKTGRTITQVIEEALRKEVTGGRPQSKPFRLQWITVSGRLQPGVDLADRDALTELMESRS